MHVRERAARWLRWAPSAVFALSTAFALGVAADEAPHIVALSGTVEIASGESPAWRAARVGDPLHAGDRVRTQADGRAEIALRTGTARLYESSLLRLPLEAGDGSAEVVDLEEGSSLFDVPPREPRRDFEVRTPEAVAMVKGTRFGVALDRAGAAVSVFRGLVGVRGLSGSALREVMVRPGATGVGGAGTPFELRVLGAGDPWPSWSAGGAGLPQPLQLRGPAPIPDAATRAGDAVRALVEQRLSLLDAGELVAPAAAAGATADTEPGAGGSELVHRAKRDVIASFAETQLAGGPGAPATGGFDVQRITSGGPNRVQITDPSGASVQLTKNDLEQIAGGNFSLYGTSLLSVLGSQGIDPAGFAVQLMDVL
jgi:hypothetical protein